MFRETLQVLVCLSVLISSSVSLHMVRDAYHRPINGFGSLNYDPVVIDSKQIAGNSHFKLFFFIYFHLNNKVICGMKNSFTQRNTVI